MPDTTPEPRLIDSARCPQCGAKSAGTLRCWLCGAEVLPAAVGGTAVASAAHQTRDVIAKQTGSFSLASLMMFVTLMAVIVGMWSIAPGIGIPLGIVLFAAWIRTVAVVQRRAAKGSDVTAQDRIVMFVRSFLSTALLLTLIAVFGGAALATAMFSVCALDRPSDVKDFGPWALGAALITIAALWVTVRLIRYRRRAWRRDIGDPEEVQPLSKASRRWLKIVIVLAFVAGVFWIVMNFLPVKFPRFW